MCESPAVGARASAPLGVHPRYTAPVGEQICSVSRDDGRLTTLDVELREVAVQPSWVALPSFVAAWPAEGGPRRRVRA